VAQQRFRYGGWAIVGDTPPRRNWASDSSIPGPQNPRRAIESAVDSEYFAYRLGPLAGANAET